MFARQLARLSLFSPTILSFTPPPPPRPSHTHTLVFLQITMPLSLSLSVCLHVWVSVSVSLCMPVSFHHPPPNVFVTQYICPPPLPPSVCLCLSVSLCVCLCLCLSPPPPPLFQSVSLWLHNALFWSSRHFRKSNRHHLASVQNDDTHMSQLLSF